MSAENEHPTSGETPASANVTSPGAMIRQGRERLNLSLDELAGVTKLSYHTIEGLERDDYSAMLEAVYVRGYYRKCAKVLDISEKALLDAYQARVAPKQPLPPAKLRLASGADLGSASRLPVMLTITLAIVAVVICTLVWMARGKSGSVPQTVETGAAINTVPAAVVPADEAVPAIAAPGVDTAPVVPAPAAGSPADAAAVVPPLPAAPATAPVPASVTPAAPAAPAAAPTPAASTAVLSFTATSWVRVDDASGKTLFNGLAQPGESHSLSGALPLNVFLGNAPAVKLDFAGKPFDTQAFTRDNKTARFTLPAR
ncbi:DUF4115 domain-containing protein [Solimonas sp. K1W22B-7]|uniref:RodZ domain-containing protein n=1 Tax=Solimonas sp. K1W22B-7 TaxID=2303331 RepID=UPI000E333B21|nr:RodZ domain-containing protein [Solimonas sp. K1W22B-7]AXQ29884.1 DUF4115 domain-containing protein [Solimonas sp. K1W22B-7]